MLELNKDCEDSFFMKLKFNLSDLPEGKTVYIFHDELETLFNSFSTQFKDFLNKKVEYYK